MDTALTKEILKKILVANNYVSEADFDAATAAVPIPAVPTGEAEQAMLHALIEKGLVSDTVFGQAAAEYYGMPFLDLGSHPPKKEVMSLLDEEVARYYHVVLLDQTDTTISIALNSKPSDELLQKLTVLFPGKTVQASYALRSNLDFFLRRYVTTLSTRFAEIIKTSEQLAPDIINQIIADAIELKASDIHIEPLERETLVRFRVDGVLSEAGRFDKKYYENILNRIKVETRLRIDEHMITQDGSLRFEKDGVLTDLRVSLVPTILGEKVVFRVLSRYVQALELSDLGLSEKSQVLVQQIASKPFGMILLAGPTGAGKTTTLYALLKSITTPSVNVTTIEDPVEYRIEGINQIQVHEEKNLTFANGLRSIVRQDPDIILVGEIRDQETADISVNAALTGHLLLSTFHANDAATAIPRLMEMGIEPFLLSSTLEIVIAERLVRRICPICRYGTKVTSELAKTIPTPMQEYLKGVDTLYKGHGCDACNHTGYYGRIGVFECIPISPAIQQAILARADKQTIADIAHREGAQSLLEDGMEKIKSGMTTMEEVVRVIGV